MLTTPLVLRIVLLALVLAATPAQGQSSVLGRDSRVYGGLGVGDGIGLVAIGSSPVVDVFTRDAALYLAYRSGGDNGRLVAALGVGGSLRLLRLFSAARSRQIPTSDLDVGLRIGPSFSAGLGEETEAERARAFAVIADPFVRATRRVRGYDAFAEIGPQSPNVRVGVSARLGG